MDAVGVGGKATSIPGALTSARREVVGAISGSMGDIAVSEGDASRTIFAADSLPSAGSTGTRHAGSVVERRGRARRPTEVRAQRR